MPRHQPVKKTQEDQSDAVFLGSLYSNQELEFLKAHFGEPSELALPEGEEIPVGVNPAAVLPILDKTYRLELLAKAAAEKFPGKDIRLWCGFDALKAVCQETLSWNETVAELKRRTIGSSPELRRAAGAPSLHMWDPDTDIPYIGGVGADADITRTALGDNGQRIPLYVALRDSGIGAIKSLAGVAKFLRSKSPEQQAQRLMDSIPNTLDYDHGESTSVVRCPICGHTEVFETIKPSTKREAERKMRKHLESARVKKEQHRVLANRLKSGKAGATSRQTPTRPPEPEAGEESGFGADDVDGSEE